MGQGGPNDAGVLLPRKNYDPKRCKSCGEVKPRSEYQKCGKSARSMCLICWGAHNRAKYRADPERHKGYYAGYRARNLERIRVRDRLRARELRAQNPERYKAYALAHKKRNPGKRYPVSFETRLAAAAVRFAIERGMLVRPDQCSQCGTTCKPHAHHPDHSKMLEVVWLCSKCHGLTWRREALDARQVSVGGASGPAAGGVVGEGH